VLANLAEAVRVVAIVTKPFIPSGSQKLYSGFSYSQSYDDVSFDDVLGRHVEQAELRVTAELKDGKIPPLYPRIGIKPGTDK
jgi:methionyl-tRNA synthetase